MLNKNSTYTTSASPFDKDSIMVYDIPRGLLKDGVTIPHNTELSERDKNWASKW